MTFPDEATRKVWREVMEAGLALVPRHMHGGIWRYVLEGIRPGHFLCALLANDLMETVAKADDVNRAALPQWVEFLVNHVPSECHGSYEKLNGWLIRFRESEPA